MSMLKIAIIAGEPSGDLLASALIKELKLQTNDQITFMGIGGKSMQQEGFHSSFDMSILSVAGFGLDLITKLPKILRIRSKIIKQIIKFKPDVFIGVDAPDFNFYIEKKLKEKGIKTIHYISPSIWAWRYERIYSIKKSTDLMLCAFPMEEEIYKKEGILAKFVGHSLATQIPLDVNIEAARENLQINNQKLIFTVLIGSRISELKRHMMIFVKACNIISDQLSNSHPLLFLFPVVNNESERLLQEFFSKIKVNFEYKIIINQTQEAVISSNQVLCKSGTVALEVALCKKPFIATYRVSSLTALILKYKLKSKFVTLPNIILQEEVVPEILQDEATAENLADNFIKLFNDEARRDYMTRKFYELHQMLMPKANTPGTAVLEFLKC